MESAQTGNSGVKGGQRTCIYHSTGAELATKYRCLSNVCGGAKPGRIWTGADFEMPGYVLRGSKCRKDDKGCRGCGRRVMPGQMYSLTFKDFDGTAFGQINFFICKGELRTEAYSFYVGAAEPDASGKPE